MARRRMFYVEFLDQDRFVRLPDKAKLLYIYLATHADDEGFLGCAQRLMKDVGAKRSALDLLVQEGFLLLFDSGVYLITHWLMHNSLRKDRTVPTKYLKERSLVGVDPAGQYYFLDESFLPTSCQPNTRQEPPQNRVEHSRAEQTRAEENKLDHNISGQRRVEQTAVVEVNVQAQTETATPAPKPAYPDRQTAFPSPPPDGEEGFPTMAQIVEYCKTNHLKNVDTLAVFAWCKEKAKDPNSPPPDWKLALRNWNNTAMTLGGN